MLLRLLESFPNHNFSDIFLKCYQNDKLLIPVFFFYQVYHTGFTPLEWQVPHHPSNLCYAKLVCIKSQNVSILTEQFRRDKIGDFTLLSY